MKKRTTPTSARVAKDTKPKTIGIKTLWGRYDHDGEPMCLAAADKASFNRNGSEEWDRRVIKALEQNQGMNMTYAFIDFEVPADQVEAHFKPPVVNATVTTDDKS